MRSAALMNDYSEIEHGLRCLRRAWGSAAGLELHHMLGRIDAEFRDQIEAQCDDNAAQFQFDTYIMSLSEHEDSEDDMGRLSMWRAYGGETGVAMVLNTRAFLSDTGPMRVSVTPVSYMSEEAFEAFFSGWAQELLQSEAALASVEPDHLKFALYTRFRTFALATKHPGFREEQEWRLFTSPSHEGSRTGCIMTSKPSEACRRRSANCDWLMTRHGGSLALTPAL